MKIRKEDALEYHSSGRKGKIEVVITKPCITQRDLSLAYTPGVAEPCREIEKDISMVYEYTAKGNLVGVISNGTAVLGLGDIGPEAGKPVMEGKGVLFKTFADLDVFDIELKSKDVDDIYFPKHNEIDSLNRQIKELESKIENLETESAHENLNRKGYRQKINQKIRAN